jgi:hypothetical protein
LGEEWSAREKRKREGRAEGPQIWEKNGQLERRGRGREGQKC